MKPIARRFSRPFFLACMGLFALTVLAQAQASPAATVPLNVAQLSATASAEAVQDTLVIVLATTREGPDASAVQSQLSRAVEAALVLGRPASRPGQLEVRSGNFSLQPRLGREGQVTGWQGTAQVLLEGRDFAAIAALAGRINTLTVNQLSFGLSRELQARLRAEAQGQAIAQFKRNAEEITRSFGLAGYTLREVSVNLQEGPWPMARTMASPARLGAAEAGVPMEAGKASISVTVSGSVQMQ